MVLELKTGNPPKLAALILAGELDAALVTEPVADAAFEKAPGLRGGAGDRLGGRQAGRWIAKAMRSRTIIAFEHGCPHRKRLEDWYAKRGEMPERSIELGSYHAMLGCAVAGMGIALLPKSVLSTFPESKRLNVQRLPAGENRFDIVLIWRKGAGSSKVQALRELLAGKGRK